MQPSPGAGLGVVWFGLVRFMCRGAKVEMATIVFQWTPLKHDWHLQKCKQVFLMFTKLPLYNQNPQLDFLRYDCKGINYPLYSKNLERQRVQTKSPAWL